LFSSDCGGSEMQKSVQQGSEHKLLKTDSEPSQSSRKVLSRNA